MNKPSAKQIRIWGEKIVESDREAFDRLFRSLYPRLVHFALRYTRNRGAASDIVQDAFVKLWKKRQDLDPDRSIKGYLYQIVRNSSLNYIRDHSKETIGLDITENDQLPSNEKEDSTGNVKPLMRLLRKWITELPERQREAFELSRFEGLDHDEIAEVMDISANTVNNHIVAALDFLRTCYSEHKKDPNSSELL